jgi:hypothetical protein
LSGMGGLFTWMDRMERIFKEAGSKG